LFHVSRVFAGGTCCSTHTTTKIIDALCSMDAIIGIKQPASVRHFVTNKLWFESNLILSVRTAYRYSFLPIVQYIRTPYTCRVKLLSHLPRSQNPRTIQIYQ
jgi:hypothetical protein